MSGGGDNTPAPTEAERALAQVAVSRFNRSQGVLAESENELIRSVFAMRSPGRMQRAAGQASAAVEDTFGEAERGAAREMVARGVDPSAGAWRGTSRALARAKERAMATGAAGAQIDQADRAMEGLGGVVAMGQGQAAEAVEGFGAVAARANEAASRGAEAAFNRATGVREIAGTATGVAAGLGVNREAL